MTNGARGAIGNDGAHPAPYLPATSMTTLPTIVSPAIALAAATLFPGVASSQQPPLELQQRGYSRQTSSASLNWTLASRTGDIYVLLADLSPAHTTLFGATFDLAFSPSLLSLSFGLANGGQQSGFLPLQPPGLPAGVPVYLQFGSWDANSGFSSLLVSNVASFAAYNEPAAIELSFQNLAALSMSGVYDHGALHRLQALPPSVRTVRPLPPQALPLPQTNGSIAVLHPSGSRFQMAFRADDLGSNGLPEQLVDVRWRPLFGAVAAETFPQFELLAAHTDVVPDYTIDPWSALPSFPNSGLNPLFAQNPRAGTLVTMFSGAYAVQPQSLLPNGYLPFPTLQQPFGYDGTSTLLLETRCSPRPGLGNPQNSMLFYLMVPSSPNPFGLVYASAGWSGPPLQPLAATTGIGGSYLFDWELVFVRTVSEATSGWLPSAIWTGPLPSPDYRTPILAKHTPPGTSLTLEFRGRNSATSTPTPWSSTQDIADGLQQIQFRVRMVANATTGAVPWLDTLLIPVQ